MGIYSLLILFFGVLIIGLVFARSDTRRPKNIVVFVVTVGAFLTAFFLIHHHIQKTCAILIGGSLEQILEIIQAWGIAAPLLSILLMILQSIIAPLPSFFITAANGLLFGVFWGIVISWIGAMAGGFLCFSITRWLYDNYARDLLKNKKSLDFIDKISSKHGFKVILIARLLPFVSFDIISYAAGLGKVKVRSFLLATGIGMLPATIVYTIFGHEMAVLEQYSRSLFIYSIGAAIVLVLILAIHGLTGKKSVSGVRR